MRIIERTAAMAVAVTLALIVPAGPVGGQTTPGFVDVPSGHIAETAIRWAATNAITAGVGNSRFGMGQTLTRYQMVTFLCRTFDAKACGSGSKGSDKFVDVPPDHWANFSIGWAVAKGITSGTGPTTFGGDGTLTREQMVTFLHRAKGSPTGGPLGSDTYNDPPSDPAHWANIPIGWAYQQGITGGISTGVFGYGTSLSREEMVLFLCRAVAPNVCAPSKSPLPSGVITSTTKTPPAKAVACDFTDHANRVSKAVYQVHAEQGIGTAFYIGNDEWLTAAHVVGNLTSVTLRRANVSLTASVVGSISTADLALLRVSTSGVPALRFGKLSDIGPGHPVFSVGFPVYVASTPSFSSGVLSRVESHAQLGSVLVTDAAVSPGNSGGPLLNRCGEVMGLVVSKIVGTGVEGISYAVSETVVQPTLPKLRVAGPSNSFSSPSGTGGGALPGNVGKWVRFSGEDIDGKYEGFHLDAIEHSGSRRDQPPTLIARCGTAPIWNSIFIATDWLIQSDVGDDGYVVVEYRLTNMEEPVSQWWWSNEKFSSSVFADETDQQFASQLRQATGSLWVRVWNGFTGESYSMRFEIGGADRVFGDLKCW